MSFNIVRRVGDPQEATTAKGRQISRQDSLFVPEWGAFVKCAPYDNHFIYENPDKSEGSSAYLCTCGSVAVVAPPGPKGMFVCLFDATYMRHQTSVVNVKDFGKVAGKTIEIAGKNARVRR